MHTLMLTLRFQSVDSSEWSPADIYVKEVKNVPSASSGSYTAAHTLHFHNLFAAHPAWPLFASSPTRRQAHNKKKSLVALR